MNWEKRIYLIWPFNYHPSERGRAVLIMLLMLHCFESIKWKIRIQLIRRKMFLRSSAPHAFYVRLWRLRRYFVYKVSASFPLMILNTVIVNITYVPRKIQFLDLFLKGWKFKFQLLTNSTEFSRIFLFRYASDIWFSMIEIEAV